MEQIKDHDFCLRCGRKLKNPEARERGYGIICYKKYLTISTHQLFADRKTYSDSGGDRGEKSRTLTR